MTEAKKSGTSSSDAAAHVKNAAEVVKGKVKRVTGKTVGNRKLQVEGQADTVKGKVKQASQSVKETLKNHQK